MSDRLQDLLGNLQDVKSDISANQRLLHVIAAEVASVEDMKLTELQTTDDCSEKVDREVAAVEVMLEQWLGARSSN
jgi:hypothetical protein